MNELQRMARELVDAIQREADALERIADTLQAGTTIVLPSAASDVDDRKAGD